MMFSLFLYFCFVMIETIFQNRNFTFTDWATVLFIISFIIIVVNKNVFEARFSDFSRLAISDKYTKVYKDSSNMKSSFTISMFFVQLISFSFFVLLLLSQFNYYEKNNGLIYLRITTFLSVFILSKYLIEKIIATIFKIEDFAEQFNLLKVSYRTYLGLLLLPVNIILFYNTVNSSLLYIAITILILLINAAIYFVTLKSYQNLIIRKIFYFILYLCTLEIAPYYFIYYWVTKN